MVEDTITTESDLVYNGVKIYKFGITTIYAKRLPRKLKKKLKKNYGKITVR